MFNQVWIALATLCLATCVALLSAPANAQHKTSAQEFEPLIKSGKPIFLDGERLYRAKETGKKARVISRPAPSYTQKAEKNKVEGVVELRAILTSAGGVKVLYALAELPDGLTEQALKAAERIKFEPAEIEGKPVSVVIILQYNFNL